MRKLFRSASVACAFLASLGAGSIANAAVLFSLTGTVGDSHWIPSNTNGFGLHGDFEELSFILPSGILQADGGPGGLIQINYAGKALVYTDDQELFRDNFESYLCLNPAGCTQTSDYVDFGGDENDYDGPVANAKRKPDSYENIIDGSYSNTLQTPAFTPYGGQWQSGIEGITVYTVDDFVSANDIGTRFTITITGAATVPEPATWAMFLVGFGGIGFMLRNSRRKGAAATA
jgi:hypothetical protein